MESSYLTALTLYTKVYKQEQTKTTERCFFFLYEWVEFKNTAVLWIRE